MFGVCGGIRMIPAKHANHCLNREIQAEENNKLYR